MTTNAHIISICVEPAFDNVIAIVDRVARDYGTSRSNILRTVLHDFFNVPAENPETQEFYMAAIERALGKK